MFFERALTEAGKVITRLGEEEVLNENELSYQEGRVSMCYQIYRQNVRNPKLLEISEKRLADIKELRKLHEPKKEQKTEEVKPAETHGVDNPDVANAEKKTEDKKQLTVKEVDEMNFQDMKKYVVANKIEVEDYKLKTMKKVLKGMIS